MSKKSKQATPVAKEPRTSTVFELGQKVRFVRMTPEGQPVYGSGVVVAKLIGVSKRINYSVRDDNEKNQNGQPKAWNLEGEALDGNKEQNLAYIAHYNRISKHIAEYDDVTKEMVKKTNAEIDAMHAEFFGPAMDI